jgi:ribosomal protein S27AE
MAKLIWNRCPKHRMDMTREYDDEHRPFYYCHICGFYRYHDGIEGYKKSLISEDNNESKSFQNIDETGPLCPQCKGNYLAPFEQDGWYCSRCKYRS